MINLLPLQDRRELAAARANTLLVRYTILLGLFTLILILEVVGAYFLVGVEKNRDEQIIADNTQKTQQFANTKATADEYRNNLATAKYILDKQAPYTKIMLTIANNLPAGAIVDRIAIDPKTFGTPTTLSVKATSSEEAILVKSSLQKAKINNVPLFTEVSFQSINASEGATNTKHKYTAQYTVVYSKGVLNQ